jgi:hypothetical protein
MEKGQRSSDFNTGQGKHWLFVAGRFPDRRDYDSLCVSRCMAEGHSG